MNIVIIEDEKPLADYLSKILLDTVLDAVIKQVIPSVEEGVAYLSGAKDIDLIFSDIQLGDGLSFEIFEEMASTIPVVFCTAYDQYTLKAFDTMGIHYIIKPFSADDIARAIQKFKALKPATVPNDLSTLIHQLKANTAPAAMPSVIIHQADKIIPLSGNDIALFYIENNIVYGYTFNGKKWPLNQKLDALEEKFLPFFYRANRQFLVNRKAVQSASQHFHRKIALVLTIDFPETILVGKEKVTDFVEWLGRG